MSLEIRRRRAVQLRERYPFAAEVLGVYLAVLDVWESARDEHPKPQKLAAWASARMLPEIASAVRAPQPLAQAAGVLASSGQAEEVFAGWLAGQELPVAERFLARACLQQALEALEEEADIACGADPAQRGERLCPRCGGPPQLSVRSASDDPLARGNRQLSCCRCSHRWNFSGSTCPSCGETKGAKRMVYAEKHEGPVVSRSADGELFPHLRIDACATCHRYLIDIDSGRDPFAVPEVDELAALPLDLYAAELGLSKVTPNLMGF